MSFDAIAPHYRWLERITAGSLLQRCRTQFLCEIADARNVLLLGEGRGRFLMELLKLNPDARITCVDASARMLELMRAGLNHCSRPSSSSSVVTTEDTPSRQGFRRTAEDEGRERGRTGATEGSVHFLNANILNGTWEPEAVPYDAIASHFFLDCFTPDQLAHVCKRVGACATPGAPWLISDFSVPDRGWQRVRARWILWVLYRFFRVVTRLPSNRLTPPDGFLQADGFRLSQREHFNHGLLHSDVWVRI